MLPVYTNGTHIVCSRAAFRLSFFYQEGEEAQLVAMLVSSPGHVKQLHKALGDQIARYERSHGEITEGRISLVKTDIEV